MSPPTAARKLTVITPSGSGRHQKLLDSSAVVSLLKRLAAPTDAAKRRLDLDHLREALRFVGPVSAEVATLLAEALETWPNDLNTTPRQLRSLLAQPEPLGYFEVAEDLLELLRSADRKTQGNGFVRYRVPPVDPSMRGDWYSLIVNAVERAVPGQRQATHELARTLAVQLTDPTRVATTHALLSGPFGSGTRQVAKAVAQAFALAGYQLVEIEMSQIRSEEEASRIDGGDPMWRGTRPGQVTSAVHEQPRTVVLLHDIDKSFTAAQASLVTAWREGVLIDNYGLGLLSEQQRRENSGRDTTRVDMRQAIVLATATTGHDLWLNADMADLLDGRSADMRDARQTVVQGMRNSIRMYRGRDVPVFDLQALQCMEPNMVIFKPLRWAALRARASQAVAEACQRASERLGLQVAADAGSVESLELVLLTSQGGHVDLDRLTGEHAERQFFTPLVDALIESEVQAAAESDVAGAAQVKSPPVREARAVRVSLSMSAEDRQKLRDLLGPLGDEPHRHLLRRRLALRHAIDVKKSDGQWCVALRELKLAQAKETADYTGDAALAAVVPDVRFSDVAGHTAAKAYLKEVISLYARADVLRAQGLELPRGAVLHGPPGTGKTLLARAMAAEADMAFISTTGSDLMNPDRVKDIFALAQKNAPALLFIDEIDALGKRGQGSGLHDAAITGILAAIQGFDQRAPIYILAATNRPHLLDPALMRPGRLDHAIYVGPLDREGRRPLVEALMRQLPPEQQLDEDCHERLLSFSHGMTGADMRQVQREVALAGLNLSPEKRLSPDDLVEAMTTHKYGQRTDARRRAELAERVAVHEAGHAVHHMLTRPEVPIEQVTVTPRGDAAGFMAVNHEDGTQVDDTAEGVRRQIGTLMAGRMAEVIHFGLARGASGGASQDLARARTLAFLAVAHKGLDEQLGVLSLRSTDDEDRVLMPEALKQEVWARVRVWLAEAEAETLDLLQRHWPAVKALSEELMATDYVSGSRVAELLALHAAEKPAAQVP